MKLMLGSIFLEVSNGEKLKYIVEYFENKKIDISEVFLMCSGEEYLYNCSFEYEFYESDEDYEKRMKKLEKEKLQNQINSLERSIELTEQKKLRLYEELKKLE